MQPGNEVPLLRQSQDEGLLELIAKIAMGRVAFFRSDWLGSFIAPRCSPKSTCNAAMSYFEATPFSHSIIK
jgi:hypothetical protein